MAENPEVPPVLPRMKQKTGRRSVASLSVVPADDPPPGPPPPANCDALEALYWRTIVGDWPADRFDGTAQILLCHLVHHLRNVAMLGDQIRALWRSKPIDMKQLRLFNKAYREEGAAAERLATRMRLTAQARYTPVGAARSALRAVPKRPWEDNSA